MIRLLQLSLNPKRSINLLNNIQFLFCKKGSNKFFKKAIDKQAQSMKPTSSPTYNIKHKQQPTNQLPKQQLNQKGQGKQRESVGRNEAINRLKQIIEPKHFNRVLSRLKEDSNHFIQKNSSHSNFETIKQLFSYLIYLDVPLNYELVQFIMDGLFTSYYIDPNNQFQNFDRRSIQFLGKQKEKVVSYLSSNNIKKQIRFYLYFKGLADRRANYSIFRSIYSEYSSFLYPLIQHNFNQVDFSSQFGQQLIQVLNLSIKNYLLNSQDIKLINSICLQVPFFQTTAIIKFVMANSALLNQADNQIILSILQVMSINTFAEIEVAQFYNIILALSQLAKKNTDINNKVQLLLLTIFNQIFVNIKKDGSLSHPNNIVYELLIELSKQILLSRQQQVERMFHYFNHLIQSLSKSSTTHLLKESNLLFQLLTIILNNKMISRALFLHHFANMRKSLQKIINKRNQLSACYLYNLLKDNRQYGLQIFNEDYLLQLNSKKQLILIQQILQLNNIQFTKSLMITLVSQRYNYLLLHLKKQLPSFNYQSILTNINQTLIQSGETPFYHYIFSEMINKQEFNELAVEVISNLYKIKQVDKKQILQIFLNAVFVKMGNKEVRTKKILASTIFVLQQYVNNAQYTQIMLSSPSFYDLINVMTTFITANTQFGQLKINIYRMVGFILERDNTHLISNFMLQAAVRKLNFINQYTEKFRSFMQIYYLEKNLMRFKIKHFVPSQQIASIYQKVSKHYLKLNDWQAEIVIKLSNPQYLPEELSKQNIVVYFMDKQVITHLNTHMDTAYSIVRQSNQTQFAIYLYKFITQQSAIKSDLFKLIWSQFTAKLANFNNILCKDILEKYQNKGLQHSLYQKLLLKVLEYYSDNMDSLNKTNHLGFIQLVASQYSVKQNCPEIAKKYIEKMKEYIENRLKYYNGVFLIIYYLPIIQLGYQLNQQQINTLKQAYYEHNLGFYLIIHHQNQLPKQQIQDMLNNYFQKRFQSRKIDTHELKSYIQLKYPKVNIPEPARWDKRRWFLNQLKNKQIYFLKIINNIFTNLTFNKKYCFLANQKHLINFCDKKNRIFYNFLQKFYAIQPQTAHLKVHIFDFNEFNDTDFYNNLQKQGIVNLTDPPQQKNFQQQKIESEMDIQEQQSETDK